MLINWAWVVKEGNQETLWDVIALAAAEWILAPLRLKEWLFGRGEGSKSRLSASFVTLSSKLYWNQCPWMSSATQSEHMVCSHIHIEIKASWVCSHTLRSECHGCAPHTREMQSGCAHTCIEIRASWMCIALTSEHHVLTHTHWKSSCVSVLPHSLELQAKAELTWFCSPPQTSLTIRTWGKASVKL